jgi:hypothetical protein
MSPAKPFLACYDYGSGGVWLLLDAPSHAEAASSFPRLQVFETRPDWMSEAEESEYRESCERKGFRWHISNPTGWLSQVKEGLA